jgi:thioredoxin 1
MAETNKVLNITDENFAEVTSKGVTLVDFWAPWCHPCRIQGPILEKVADRVGDKAQICKINVDESRETAMKYGISGIPSLLVFKDGKKVTDFVGVQGDDVLISSLEAHI